MANEQIDRINGLVGSIAFKAPCRAATTANVALSGFGTYDGIVFSDGDANLRLFVWFQNNPIDNGIWNVSAGAWSRAADFDGNRDVVKGTQIEIQSGTLYGGNTYKVSSVDPVVIGTSAITFEQSLFGLASSIAYTPHGNISSTNIQAALSEEMDDLLASSGSSLIGFIQAGTGAVAELAQSKLREIVSTRDFSGDIVSAITQAAVFGGQLIVNSVCIISSTLNIPTSVTMRFERGGMIHGNAGTESVTFEKPPQAGRYQIFQNCVPSATAGMTVFPEWFGAIKDGNTSDTAAFIAAYYCLRNVGGIIQMDAGNYGLSATLTGVKSKVALQGAGRGITVLFMNTVNTAGIQAYGTAAPNTLNFIAFKDFTLRLATPASAGCFGLDVHYTTEMEVESVEIADFLYDYKIYQTTNATHTNMLCTYQGMTTGCINYVIDGDGGSLGNASTKFLKCDYSGNANIGNAYAAGSIGVRITGAYLSDLTLDFEGTQTAIGVSYDGTSAGATVKNVHMRLTLDQFLTQGLSISNVGAYGQITIEGGWINAKNTGAETDGILITACRGITITGGLAICGTENIAHAYGIKIATGQDIVVDESVQICDTLYGISGNSTAACTFSPRFYNVATAATAYVNLVGDARSFVDGASLDGFATNGVVVDATSSGTGITCCKAITTNIGTRFTNGASGPIGGATGSTGLNSGV